MKHRVFNSDKVQLTYSFVVYVFIVIFKKQLSDPRSQRFIKILLLQRVSSSTVVALMFKSILHF